MSISKRVAAILLAIVLSVPFAVAVTLNADESGRGTHRQLGFPPCALPLVVGVPCPMCGMTTSWALLVGGHPREAWSVHPAGFLLASWMATAVGISLKVAFTGRIVGGSTVRWMQWSGVAIGGIVMLRWFAILASHVAWVEILP